jgi:hypothetical protein
MVSSVWELERRLGLIEGTAIRELIRPVVQRAGHHAPALQSSIEHDWAAVKKTAKKTGRKTVPSGAFAPSGAQGNEQTRKAEKRPCKDRSRRTA